MTILIFRQGPGAKSLIACDNCGEQEWRLTCICKKSKLHYCDIECRFTKPSKYSDPQYREDMRVERKDAKLKIQDKVKKRCTKCKTNYEGPPGGFPKSRDPEYREPGLCPACSQHIPYDEGETAGVVNAR